MPYFSRGREVTVHNTIVPNRILVMDVETGNEWLLPRTWRAGDPPELKLSYAPAHQPTAPENFDDAPIVNTEE